MRRLLVVLFIVAALFVGLGFYLDWFQLSTKTSNGSGETKINLTIDREKMKDDAKEAKDKLHDLGSKASEKLSPAK